MILVDDFGGFKFLVVVRKQRVQANNSTYSTCFRGDKKQIKFLCKWRVGVPDPIFLMHKSFCWGHIRLLPTFQLPRLSGCAIYVPVGWCH